MTCVGARRVLGRRVPRFRIIGIDTVTAGCCGGCCCCQQVYIKFTLKSSPSSGVGLKRMVQGGAQTFLVKVAEGQLDKAAVIFDWVRAHAATGRTDG